MTSYVHAVAQAAQADTLGISVPFEFAPPALNRFLVVFVATCHPTGGLSGEPVSSVVYAGVDIPRHRGEAGTEEVGVVPPRSIMYDSRSLPFTSVPIVGDVVVTFSEATHAVVHVVGLVGAAPNGFWDADSNGGVAGSAAINGMGWDVFYEGLMGVALRGSGGAQSPGAGILSELGTGLVAGSGASAVRGSVWRSVFEASNWRVDGSATSWAATGLTFKGGLATYAEVPLKLPHSEFWKHEMFWRTGLRVRSPW